MTSLGDLAPLLNGINRHHRSVHGNTAAWWDLILGGRIDALKIPTDLGGTGNQDAGWGVVGARQVADAFAGHGAPEHARPEAVARVVAGNLEQVRGELLRGLQRQEIMSVTYALFWILFRMGLWVECHRILAHLPEHQGVRELIGALETWGRVKRSQCKVFRAPDGVVQAPSVRIKERPDASGSPHADTLLAYRFDGAVETVPQRAMFENRGHRAWGRQPQDAFLDALLRSPWGAAWERATRGFDLGRLASPVGIFRRPDGSFRAVMPSCESAPDRYARGGPYSNIRFLVEVDGRGRVVDEEWVRDLSAPRGAIVRSPRRVRFPDGAFLIAPDSPAPEVRPYSGPPLLSVAAPSPTRPLPRDVTPKDVADHPAEVTRILGAAMTLHTRTQQVERLRIAMERVGGSATPRNQRLAVVAAMAAVDQELTDDPALVEAVADFRRALRS